MDDDTKWNITLTICIAVVALMLIGTASGCIEHANELKSKQFEQCVKANRGDCLLLQIHL